MNVKKAILFFYPIIDKEEIFPNIPWAYLYLERMIRHLDVEMILLDERLEHNLHEKINEYKDRVLFAAVSVMLGRQITGALAFTEIFRSISDKPVLWGGWFPTITPEIILKEKKADYICLGQGEIPFKQFTENFLAGKSLTNIDGICTIKDNELILNTNTKFTDSNTFPRINFDLIDINKLIDINEIVPAGERKIDYLATSGCTYKCKFCNAVSLFNRKWYPKPVEQIIEDIRYLKEKANISHIDFRCDNFFGNRNFILSVCELFIKENFNITWEANVHLGFLIKNFSDDEMELIYKSGCRMLRIGAESGDDEVLKLIDKKITISDTYRAVRFLKKHHIKTRLLTMCCFPFHPKKDFWNTVKLIGRTILIDHRVEPRLRFFVPIPKIELYDISVEKGFKLPENTEELLDYYTNSFVNYYITPWNTPKYITYLSNFKNFYFLWANPTFYKNFPPKHKPVAFLLTLVLFPLTYMRFKFSFLKFHFEAKLFKKFTKLAHFY